MKPSNTSRDNTVRLKRALVALKDMRAKLDAVENARAEPIAIIGMGCRFPGANNPDAFWDFLKRGGDAIGEIPQERWDVDAYYDPDPTVIGKMYTRFGGFIDHFDKFDASFFGMTPREVTNLDPQQRWLLEVSWEALEHAAFNPDKLNKSKTGVFVGIGPVDYLAHAREKLQYEIDAYLGTGTDNSVASGRLSYFLGLNGPSLAVDTACSSSLVAVHLAVTSLRNRECSLALAGGVSALLSPDLFISQCQAKMLSADGRCKTFDSSANGYVRSEGCGMVVLKRLSDALADGDNIYALIRGSAVNQDGRTNGLTAPNGLSQQAVVRQALKNGCVKPASVSYVETHGSGTPLGDPIEVNALGSVFDDEERLVPLFIGTVKTNVGHLETAAGMAGLIKTVLALQHGQIPPNLHFSTPNRDIPWDELPITVATELTAWPTEKRLAGVSSFGFSGTNAHVVLEAAPNGQKGKIEEGKGKAERPLHLLTLSAKSAEALQELAERYIQYLDTEPDASLADICFTANSGRAHFHHRLAVVAADKSQAREKLAAFRAGKPAKGLASGRMQRNKRPKVAFLFSGQGSQYVNMGRKLYETEPIFRQVLDQCHEIWQNQKLLPTPLLEVLYPAPTDKTNALIDQTAYTQPALFAIEYALAKLWKSWGVEPDLVMGHSAGEYAAACFAGIMSLQDGLILSAARGRLMETVKVDSATAAVFASADVVRDAIAPYAGTVGLAGLNAPEETLIAGVAADVYAVQATLKEAGIGFRPVQVSQASHSPVMEPILDEFEQIARQIDYSPPRMAVISNVTGDLIDKVDATYWRRHMREPVQFVSGMKKIEEAGCDIILEIGPQPVLLWLGRQNWTGSDETLWLSSLWAIRDDWEQLQQSAAQAYVRGVEINWNKIDQDRIRHKVVLPTYPWQRQRYWIEGSPKHVPRNEGLALPPLADSGAGHALMPQKESQSVSTKELPSQNRPKEELLLQDLRQKLANIFELDIDAIEPDATFVEMGADSLLLGRVTQAVEKHYGVKIGINQLFDELDSPDTLVTHLSEQLPAEWNDPTTTLSVTQEVVSEVPVEPVQKKTAVATLEPTILTEQNAERLGSSTSALERVVNKQLDLMAKQLELLGGNGASMQHRIENGTEITTQAAPRALKQAQPSIENKNQERSRATSAISAVTTVAPPKPKKLYPKQQAHLDALIKRYSERTAASKQYAQGSRGKLADTRSMPLFRLETKEMVYPIIGQRAHGAHFWDIDGNEYVDIAMGMGAHLCGHSPSFIAKAVSEQLQHTIQTGPAANLGWEVAELIGELTGMERVLFSVTGTGAVRGALRLARTATGREKFVMFKNAYHGESDGMLGIPDIPGGPLESRPMVPGVSSRAVKDMIILPYDSDHEKSLEIIKQHAHELGGVLVEPVQSRSPGLQPKVFLKALRQLTSEINVPLIFDEVITGFRVHPGGAQAWFGVEADIVTYGKAVGGGMPVSVIAGKAIYLDRVDGGMWSYGDASYPTLSTTFIGSTFEMHPLAMATSRAILQHLKQEGPALQQRLNQRTTQLAETLNGLFEQEQVPIKVTNFGSLFRFAWKGNVSYVYQPLDIDLFYYHLTLKGVYTWEGRTCFLSTAHTDSDIAHIIRAVTETIAEMKKGGFLSKPARRMKASEKKSRLKEVPLSEEQKELWKLARKEGELEWRNSVNILLRGPFRLSAMQRAMEKVVIRHEALRTTISRTEPVQFIHPTLNPKVDLIDLTHLTGQAQEEAVTEWLSQEIKTPFELSNGPLMRSNMLKLEQQLHLLAIDIHHIISDGWSIDIILSELASVYAAECQGTVSQLDAPHQYREFISWQAQQVLPDGEAYWLDQFGARFPVANLPTDKLPQKIREGRSNDLSHRGNRYSARFDAEFTRQLKQMARAHKSTLFMTLLSGYGLLLHRLTGQDEFVIGTPTAGRASFEHSETVVGYCPHFLPIRTRLVGNPTVSEYLMTLKKTILAAYKHQDYPFARLLSKLNGQKEAAPYPVITTLFNLDGSASAPEFFDLQSEFFQAPANFALVDFRLDVIQIEGELWLDYDYRTDLFKESTISRWHDYFEALLKEIVAKPQQYVADLPNLEIRD